ncbi:hypothetical protein LINPERPRIM_LOCUS41008 [Linum perenne]
MIVRDLFWYPMHHPMLYPGGNLRLNALHEDTMYLRDPVWSAIHHPRLYLEGNLRLVLVVTNVIGNIQRGYEWFLC